MVLLGFWPPAEKSVYFLHKLELNPLSEIGIFFCFLKPDIFALRREWLLQLIITHDELYDSVKTLSRSCGV